MVRVSVLKLSNKRVVDSDGGEVGMLHNIVAEANTGLLRELVVKPSDELETSKFKEEDGYIFIPFDAVSAVKDVIVVDTLKMRVRA